ncbi:LamG domain-containing protein, partial [Microbulbifer sp. SA54]|uniref:LamG domain-containing protein n=1 Tax=Microbulbifer sp. SA54 TaxID=3401577 RepID=UPI003AAE5148
MKGRLLSLLVIAFGFLVVTTSSQAGEYRDLIMADGPIAYWAMERNQGSTLNDETGNAPAFTSKRTPEFVDSERVIADAVVFDGQEQYLSLNTALSAFATPFTLELWVKLDEITGRHILLQQGEGDAGSVPFSLHLAGNSRTFDTGAQTAGHFAFVLNDGQQTIALSDPQVAALDEWYYLAVTYSGSSLSLFRNGEVVASVSYSGGILPTAQPFYLGGQPDNATYLDNEWSKVGNSLSIAGAGGGSGATVFIDASTIVYVDTNNEQLRTYQWNGSDWSQVGNSLQLGSLSSTSMARLSATEIVLAGDYSEIKGSSLRTFSWDGTDWSQVGNTLQLDAYFGTVSVTTIDTNRIAFREGSLFAYEWDGTNWTKLGGALPGASTSAKIASIATNTIAYADSASDELRTYLFDGVDWIQIGNALSVSPAGGVFVTSIGGGRVAFIDSSNDELRAYSWDGVDWALDSAGLPISGTSFAMSSYDTPLLAIYGSGILEAYQLSDVDGMALEAVQGLIGDVAFYSKSLASEDIEEHFQGMSIPETIVFNENFHITSSDMEYEGKDVIVDGAEVTIDGEHNFKSLIIQNGGVITHSDSAANVLVLEIDESVKIDAASSINLNGKGDLPLAGDYLYSGGSYGGLGGRASTTGNTNAPFGDYKQPLDFGAGGYP